MPLSYPRPGRWLNTNLRRRWAVTYPGVGGSGTTDLQFVIPAQHPIWAELDADGDEDSIRITAGDGVSELTFQLTDAAFSSTFDTANRDGGIQVQSAPHNSATTAALYYVYAGWANASSGANSFTPSGVQTAYLWQGAAPNRGRLVRPQRAPAAATEPDQRLAKISAETVRHWMLLNPLCPPLGSGSWLDRLGFMAPRGTTYAVSTAGGGSTASMVDTTSQRFVETADGRLYVTWTVGAGVDANVYTMAVTVVTADDHSQAATTDETIQIRYLLDVQDVNDP